VSAPWREPAGPPTGPGRDRYLLGSRDPGLLAELAARLPADHRVRVLRAPAPDVLSIEATPDAVEALRAAHGDRLVIESDAPLDLLPDGPPV
jgi:hypothetical protein